MRCKRCEARLLALTLSTFFAWSTVGLDGELDPSFGTGGGVLVDLSPPASENDSALATVLVQPDGKIVVAGSFLHTANTIDWDYAVARLNADGSTDINFGVGGRLGLAVDLVPGGRDEARDATLLPGGKIVVAGMADDTAGLNRRTALYQLLPDGSLDETFGVNGLYFFGSNQYQDFFQAVDGTSRGDRLSTLAFSFDQPGALDTAIEETSAFTRLWTPPDLRDASMHGLAEVRGSRRFLAGELAGATSDLCVLALTTPEQSPHGTFGDQGWVFVRATSTGGEWNSQARAVAHYPGNRVMAGGTADRDLSDAFVVRLLPDGSLDPTFAGGGQQYMRWQLEGTIRSDIYDIDVQADGAIVFGGVASDGIDGPPVIARLDASGAYDLNFMGTGWGTLPDPPGYLLLGQPSITLQPDGHLIVAVRAVATDPAGFDKVYVVRLLSPSTVMFYDGFESGNLTSWSVSVP